MTQHTKGEWTVARDKHTLEIQSDNVRNSDEPTVAIVINRAGIDAEDEANARLIAAAPKLLEALEYIQTNLLKNNRPPLQEFAQIAKAAIAAARGKE